MLIGARGAWPIPGQGYGQMGNIISVTEHGLRLHGLLSSLKGDGVVAGGALSACVVFHR